MLATDPSGYLSLPSFSDMRRTFDPGYRVYRSLRDAIRSNQELFRGNLGPAMLSGKRYGKASRHLAESN